jgi:hypothetical protein
MRSLEEYRAELTRLEGGTIPVTYAMELLDSADAAVAASRGEYTVSRAVELSRRSRSWIKRRLADWQAKGLARQLDDGTWLVKDAALPRAAVVPRGGFDPALGPEEIARRLYGAAS